MPSFDIVSEIDMHEATNAIDQANREVNTRFDFKGSDAKYTINENDVTMTAQSDFQLQQMLDILYKKLTKRSVDVGCLQVNDSVITGRQAQQIIILRQGLDKDLSRKVVKLVKEAKLKVQAAIQGEKVRITGKKRDDLQDAIAMLREQKLELPLQYNNFRD